jgi:MFS family permease
VSRLGRDFALLWAGQGVSQVGSAITPVALPLLALAALDASAADLGLLTAAGYAAWIFVGLPAGALLDRVRRRPVLIAADLGRALALASVPVAAAAGVLTLAQLYVVALVTGVLSVVFEVGWTAYLPAVVPRERLADGNARLSVTASAAHLVGPGAGGVLVQLLGAGLAVLADAASFLVSAVSLGAIRSREPRPPRAADRHLGREIGEGLRHVFTHPLLRAFAGAAAVANLGFAAVQALTVVFLVRDLGQPPGTVGLLMGLGTVGGIVGGVLAPRLLRRLGSARGIVVATAATLPFGLLVPLAGRGAGLAWFVAGQVVVMAGIIVFNVGVATAIQSLVPSRLLGRANASFRLLTRGALPVGAVLGGLLGEAYGARWALGAAYALNLFAVAPLLLSPLRRLRDLPAPAEPADAARVG